MFLSFLTVVGIGTVLAVVVLLHEQGIHGESGIHAEGDEGHLGALLHDFGVINGIVGRGTPGEGAVVLDQHGGSVVGIDLADVQDLIHDDVASLQLVLSLDLFLRHIARARDILIEIVGVRGADVGDIAASLSEGSGVGGVGVDHALDVGECLI